MIELISVIGTVVIIVGAAIGIMRWTRKPRKGTPDFKLRDLRVDDEAFGFPAEGLHLPD